MTQLLPPKKEVALALLERSNVDVYLDPRASGVVVPPQFRKEPRLILKIGLNMPVPIPDLRLDDESMSCTLSFSRSPFFCVVPWESVFAMVGDDGRGMVWPDDVPQELAVRVVEERKPEPVPGPALVPAPAPTGPAGAPRAVEGGSKGNGRRGKPAVAGDDAAGDRPSRGKRSRKKKEERPALVAVPPAPQAPERPTPMAERRDAVSPVAPVTPVAPVRRDAPPSQRPGAAPGAPGARPKRELPPYLRVVK